MRLEAAKTSSMQKYNQMLCPFEEIPRSSTFLHRMQSQRGDQSRLQSPSLYELSESKNDSDMLISPTLTNNNITLGKNNNTPSKSGSHLTIGHAKQQTGKQQQTTTTTVITPDSEMMINNPKIIQFEYLMKMNGQSKIKLTAIEPCGFVLPSLLKNLHEFFITVPAGLDLNEGNINDSNINSSNNNKGDNKNREGKKGKQEGGGGERGEGDEYRNEKQMRTQTDAAFDPQTQVAEIDYEIDIQKAKFICLETVKLWVNGCVL